MQQGFQLLVIPHVIPNSDKVMVTVIPEAEQLVGTSTTLPGFDEFTSGVGANEVSILLPRVSASTIVTHMIVRSGETAVLGGLLSRQDTEIERGIPGLKSIPIIKWLFTVKERQKTMSNLIVFMTPRVIQSSEDIEMHIKDSLRKYRNQMEKDWDDMFPWDFPSKRTKREQSEAVPNPDSIEMPPAAKAEGEGCGEGEKAEGCGEKSEEKEG